MPWADALAGFLRALGRSGADIPLDPDERAALFRTETTGRTMLLILDNALSAEQVRPLLPGSPSCAVVAAVMTGASPPAGAMTVPAINALRLCMVSSRLLGGDTSGRLRDALGPRPPASRRTRLSAARRITTILRSDVPGSAHRKSDGCQEDRSRLPGAAPRKGPP